MSTVEELEQVFSSMDTNGNGELSLEEVTQYLVGKRGFNQSFVQDFFQNFDSNGDGIVTLDECKRKLNLIPEREVECSAWWQVFQSFDKDGSGYIEISELPQVLSEIGSTTKYDQGHFQRWVSQHDADGDGRISYNEFLNWIRARSD